MSNQILYWGMMTPRELRVGSLVAIFGLFCKHFAAPMMADQPFWAREPVYLFGELAGFLLLMWIVIAAPGWRGVMPGELDEREVAERQKSFVIAYWFTGTLLLLASAYRLGVSRHGWWLPPASRHPFDPLWSLAWVHMAMPAIVLAWRELWAERLADGDVGDEAP